MEMDVDAYYMRVQSAYDGIAPLYDASVGNSAVSRRAKLLAVRIVKGLTPSGGRLLDIGCYTGIEALLLAEQRFCVVGVDLSPAMIRITQATVTRPRLQ